MHKKKKDEYLSKCRDRIKGAERWRKNEGYEDLWERLIDLYRGKHFRKDDLLDQEDRIAVNVAFSTINVIAPSVSVSYPKISVASRLPENEDSSVVIEALINYWWRTYEVKPEFQLAVKDWLILGHAWMKTGYRFVEEEKERDPDKLSEEFEELSAQADDYAIENPDLAAETPTDEEILANMTTTELKVLEDRPFTERINPMDMFVDPEATSLRDARWIAQRVVKDLDEVQENKNFKASVRKDLKGDAVLNESMRPMWGNDTQQKQYERVTLWEYYDIKKGTMCLFAEEGDGFLVDPVDQPYAFGHPFIMMRNYEVPNHLYPMGELESIEPLQHELNKSRSQQMNHRKRFTRKYFYDKRAFSGEAIGLLQNDVDGTCIPVEEGIPMNEALMPVPTVPLDPQLYADTDRIEGDINMISGVSEYQRGGSPDVRKTATEANMIQDATNARSSDKLAQVEAAISMIARRLVQLAQQYTTNDQVVRVVGQNGAPIWVNVEPDWLKGEFDYEVEAGSTQPQDETFKRNNAMTMLQSLAPMMAPGGPINTPELLKYVFENGFGIKDASRFVNVEQEPVDPMTGQPLGSGPPEEIPAEEPEPEGDPIPPEVLAQLGGAEGAPEPAPAGLG